MESKFKRILYGGDYNPNQWPKEIWDEDMKYFKDARINSATINVFSWAKLQPSEEVYDFRELDDIIEMLSRENYDIVLATSTGALPAWLVRKYPEVARTDEKGRHHKFGLRHNACPNSPVYQKYAAALAAKLAERYGSNEHIACWHINNEYGGECYCENCEKEFRVWLRKKYGTLEALNKAWNLEFWGHTVWSWDDIVLPNELSEGIDGDKTAFAGISIDYRRFNSDSLLGNYVMERDAIRCFDQKTPITTNLMGTYKGLDYFKWAKEMDIVSWDNYPAYDTPWSYNAMCHDLMRGLKGAPFMLMEQTPSQQNWQPYNALKRPGVMRLWSYQAVARGADTVMFFQLRRSIGACEKYHGAVIAHAGRTNTRVFREVAALGEELQRLGDALLDSRVESRVGILFDWDNWWAVEFSSGPSRDLQYLREVQKYYDAFYRHHVSVDMIHVDSDFSQYDVVVAPVLYMVKPGVARRLEDFVSAGGTFVTTFFSGLVNQNDLVIQGGYPGELRKLLGIWVEEIDALLPDMHNRFVVSSPAGAVEGEYRCGMLCDLLHSEGADIVAVYGHDFYKGMPAVTRNPFGKGHAWYVASSPEPSFLDDLAATILQRHDIRPPVAAPADVEVTVRRKGASSYTFLLNHGDVVHTVDLGDGTYKDLLGGGTVTGQVRVNPKDVWVLES